MIDLILDEVTNNTALSVGQMCAALDIARADYYPHQDLQREVAADLELRHQLQGIALEMSAYGYRRITHELRRRGVVVNHKRVLRADSARTISCV